MREEKTIKICIGLTEDNLIVYANLNIRQNGYYSITHDTLRELLTEEEGEERGKEYLEDGELWKQAVEANNTTLGLDDWVEYVLDTDSWETIIDANFFGTYEDTNYYSTWDGCGASIEDFKKEYKLLLISQEDLNIIIDSDKLHLKEFKKYSKKDKELFAKISNLMDKYKNQKDYKEIIIENYLKEV